MIVCLPFCLLISDYLELFFKLEVDGKGFYMTDINFCQSCVLQFEEAHRELIAKEADGNDSIYCTYCYKDGKFLNPDATVEDMMGMGVPHLAHKIGEQAAREQLSAFVPTLKRWRDR